MTAYSTDADRIGMCIIDSGANINIATQDLVDNMHLSVVPHQGRRIGTAQQGQFVQSVGIVKLGGVIGEMEVVPTARNNLVGTSIMAKYGATTIFNSDGDGGECVIKVGSRELVRTKPEKVSRLYCAPVSSLLQTTVVDPLYTYVSNAMNSLNTTIPTTERKRWTRQAMKDLVHRVIRLHKCLGHQHFRALATGVRDGIIVNSKLSYAEIMLASKHIQCVACALAKWPKHLNPGSGIRPIYPFETISIDDLGPYQPAAKGGYHRALIAVDCCVLYGIGRLIKVFNSEECISFVREIVSFAKRFRFVIRRVRFDAGRIENSSEFREFLADNHIEGCPAGTELQNQNPIERYVQTVKNTISAVMADQSELGPAFWGFSLLMSISMRNMVCNSTCPDSSPNFEVMGLQTDISINGNHYFGEKVVVPRTGGKGDAQRIGYCDRKG